MNRPGCEARAESDQMYCVRCGLRWDNNSIDPPECMPRPKSQHQYIQRIERIKPPVRVVDLEEQAEINRRGMALLRETLNHE